MDHRYHVTVFDNFHPYDPDEAWVMGTFETAEAAIAAVKSKIDAELTYLWSEVCHQDKGISTLDRLVDQFKSFAECPVAFGRGEGMVFDSTAYMRARAAEMVRHPPDPYPTTGGTPKPPASPAPSPPSVPSTPAASQPPASAPASPTPRFAAVKAVVGRLQARPAFVIVALVLIAVLVTIVRLLR